MQWKLPWRIASFLSKTSIATTSRVRQCIHRPERHRRVFSRSNGTGRAPAGSGQLLSAALQDSDGKALPGENIAFHRTHSRHVLRGILRECTYFPDPFAGGWIRQYALSRYRTYESKIAKQRKDEVFVKSLELVRRKSRQALYQMQRANEGDRKMLLKALHMAYGRIGQRRRELLSPLMPVAGQADEKSLSTAMAPVALAGFSFKGRVTPPGAIEPASKASKDVGPVKAQVKDFVASFQSPLRALLDSQIRAAPPTVTRRNPRKLGVEIPELNTWRKPMPQSRVKNMLREYQAKLLDQIQVPLPEEDWHRLYDLATGKIEYSLPVTQRKKLALEMTALELIVVHGKVDKQIFRKDHARTVTSKLMRSLWTIVFEQCPLMKYDGEKEKWGIIWGMHALHAERPAAVSAPVDPSAGIDGAQDHELGKLGLTPKP